MKKVCRLEKQPNNTSFLYRYITIDKLIDIVINGRFPLTRLNLFDDKLEGTTPEHLLLNLGSDKIAEMGAPFLGNLANFVTFNVNPTKRNSLSRKRSDFQKFNYASCWFVSDHESIAMWQLYSRPDSIAIKIPCNQLIDELELEKYKLSIKDYEKIKYGLVEYFRFDDIDSIENIVDSIDIQGFVKDKSFSHENEFRIIISIAPKINKKLESKDMVLDEQIQDFNERLDLKTIYIKFDNFKSLPFELIFHPQSRDWHKSNVRNIIKKYDLNFSISDSKLIRVFK